MKSVGQIAICAGLLALVAYVTLIQAQQKSPQLKNASISQEPQVAGLLPHGKVKDGLAAFLLCHSDRFKVGEPIPLSYGIVNVGSSVEAQGVSPVRVWKLRSGPVDRGNVTWLEVTGPDGKKVSYHGRRPRWRDLSAAVEETSVLLHHRQFIGNIISRIKGFEMKKPGIYKVRWGYKPFWGGGPWTGMLMSNEVQFEIVE